jgi:hypothetical protein
MAVLPIDSLLGLVSRKFADKAQVNVRSRYVLLRLFHLCMCTVFTY